MANFNRYAAAGTWRRDQMLRKRGESLRLAAIAFLRSNDPNGAYSDADCDAEALPRLTLQGALAMVLNQIAPTSD